MDKLNLDIDYYSHNELCEMFEIDPNNLFDKTELNSNYNKMITSVKGEVHIPDTEKENILKFLEKAFLKMLEKDSDYKLTEGNFMPNLEKTQIFSKENPVIKKEFKEDLTSLINPLKTKHITKLLNINTLFRKNYYKQDSADFIIDLPNTLKNVTSLTLINTEIPNTMYTFSGKNGTNEFTVETYQTESGVVDAAKKRNIVIRIKEGNYSPKELCDYLNRYIFSPKTGDIELKRIACQYDTITKKIVFFRDKRTDANGGVEDTGTTKYYFNIDWRLSGKPNRSIQLNMGWILGFRKSYYVYDDDYVEQTAVSYDKNEGFEAEACYQNLNGQRYIFLSINDFNKNYSKTMLSPFEDSVINDDNIFAKINNASDSFDYSNGDVDFLFKRTYFGPVDLMKLRIRILDEFGRVVDLNKSDYSFTIKVEQLYDLNSN